MALQDQGRFLGDRILILDDGLGVGRQAVTVVPGSPFHGSSCSCSICETGPRLYLFSSVLE